MKSTTRTVTLSKDIWIDAARGTQSAGAAVEVDEQRARDLIAAGYAVPAAGETEAGDTQGSAGSDADAPEARARRAAPENRARRSAPDNKSNPAD